MLHTQMGSPPQNSIVGSRAGRTINEEEKSNRADYAVSRAA